MSKTSVAVSPINGIFTVLLVEDNPSSVERPLRLVSDYLREREFELIVILKKDSENVKSVIHTQPVDVIVTDYKIEEGFSGEDVVKLVKKSGFWTDVLFYSQKDFVEEDVRKSVDYGFITFLHDREIEEPLRFIIDRNLRRYGDLLYLRGLVISRVIDLEMCLNDLLFDYFKPPKTTSEQFDSFILGNSDFSYGAKLKVIDSIMELESIHSSNKSRDTFFSVFFRLAKARNALAHCKLDPKNPNQLLSMGLPHKIDRKSIVETLMMSRTAFQNLEQLRKNLGLATK